MKKSKASNRTRHVGQMVENTKRHGKRIRVVVAGPSLICSALATLVSTFDAVDAANPFDNGESCEEVDVWLLLTWDHDDLKRAVSETWFEALAADSMQCRTLLVAPAPPALSSSKKIQGGTTETLLRLAGTAGICAFVGVNDAPEVLEQGLLSASLGAPFCSATLNPLFDPRSQNACSFRLHYLSS